MPFARPLAGVAVALITVSLASGCGLLVITPDPTSRPPRFQWIIAVTNSDDEPATLFVAEDETPMGDEVGTATPTIVEPGITTDVVFKIPAGDGPWAIFVNPGPDNGAAITSRDVPNDVSGKLPIHIQVDGRGSLSIRGVPDDPGWFGN